MTVYGISLGDNTQKEVLGTIFGRYRAKIKLVAIFSTNGEVFRKNLSWDCQFLLTNRRHIQEQRS